MIANNKPTFIICNIQQISILAAVILYNFNFLLNSFAPQQYFFVVVVACLTCTADSIELVIWGTWHRCQRWGSIVEWRTLLQAKNSTGCRWDSSPGPCCLYLLVSFRKHDFLYHETITNLNKVYIHMFVEDRKKYYTTVITLL